ncbi:MAG: hypothetical protein AAF497_13810, partial [Planctomycetota bacterium]
INSLVGSSSGNGVVTLYEVGNSNYVVADPSYGSAQVKNRGAVTFGNGLTGVSGTINSANSFVGSSAEDRVGEKTPSFGGFEVLSNGNYVVRNTKWDNGLNPDAGFIAMGDGNTGLTGVVSSSNSLVGLDTNDFVGIDVTPLPNGNYVATSAQRTASNQFQYIFTLVDGTTPFTGTISDLTTQNSLISLPDSDPDTVNTKVVVLENGNYAVTVPKLDIGSAIDAGAVTVGNSVTGVQGNISSTNSLVGGKSNDRVGGKIVPLRNSNGNFVVVS